MDQLLSMGFPQELASQALAATGGKSTLKATEWLLTQRAEASAAEASSRGGANNKQQQQARVDRFFSNSPRAHVAGLRQISHPAAPSGDGIADAVACRDSRGEEDSKVCPFDASASSSCFAVNGDVRESTAPGKPFRPFVVPPSPPIEPPHKRKTVEEETDFQTKAPPMPLLPSKLTPLPASKVNSKIPLAERMRPSSIDEILGQEHLLNPGCILRSLLESDTMPSVIFWGPPGTGKTSLARAISRSISCRFVTASAVTSGVKDVREILEEAKRMKKTGQRTLFFMDEVHRFNKAQQDAFLPSIEAGHVVFIGATTENPSFEVNAALLSRCRVLTLNKLQPESVKQVLERALSSADRGVMASFAEDPFVQRIEAEVEALQFLAEAADGDARVALNALEIAVASAVSREKQRSKQIQENSFHSPLATDMNDVRTQNVALSAMERSRSNNPLSMKRELPLKISALKESLGPSQEEYTRPFKRFVGGREVMPYGFSKEREMQSHEFSAAKPVEDTKGLTECAPISPKVKDSSLLVDSNDAGVAFKHPALVEGSVQKTAILVRLVDVSEALQRSHLLYDKKGEEHYNVISALHKSMRGGDPDAALYWLARMMEGGEGPLYIARRLIRFASEDVGLADPQAITVAVACYQACHFIGMPECNVHLAQCVAYLSLAPKSVAIYQAIEAAQQLVKKKGNEPVPLHLRNAPTALMKQLGYGQGYIYPPNHEGPVEQDYLPPSLRGQKFLKWP